MKRVSNVPGVKPAGHKLGIGLFLAVLVIVPAIWPEALPIAGALLMVYAGHLLTPMISAFAPFTYFLPPQLAESLEQWARSLASRG